MKCTTTFRDVTIQKQRVAELEAAARGPAAGLPLQRGHVGGDAYPGDLRGVCRGAECLSCRRPDMNDTLGAGAGSCRHHQCKSPM